MTGVVDAVSYLGIGGVFTANQTGNLVLMGFAIGGAQGFSVPRTLMSLAGFALGAMVAGYVARHWHPRPFRWMQRVTWAIVVAFCAILVMLLPLTDDTDDHPGLRLAVVALLGIVMGLLNATVRRLGFTDIPTTVATSTISDLASESRWGGGERRNQRDRALAIGAMVVGAMAGVLLVREASLAAGFGLALLTTIAAAGHQIRVAGVHDTPRRAG